MEIGNSAIGRARIERHLMDGVGIGNPSIGCVGMVNSPYSHSPYKRISYFHPSILLFSPVREWVMLERVERVVCVGRLKGVKKV